jgi:hypothetical protein
MGIDHSLRSNRNPSGGVHSQGTAVILRWVLSWLEQILRCCKPTVSHDEVARVIYCLKVSTGDLPSTFEVPVKRFSATSIELAQNPTFGARGGCVAETFGE